MSQVDFLTVAEPENRPAGTPSGNYIWWSALRHGGCLITPSRLEEFFPKHAEQLASWNTDRLRRALSRLEEDNDKAALNQLLDEILIKLLGLPAEQWTAGNQVDNAWSVKAMTGEVLKPRHLWQEPGGGLLPVFIAEEAASGPGRTAPKLGLGRGRRSVARVVEWLRRKQQKVALLTNGHQWRLIHAGADYDAWCEWDTDAWFLAGAPGPQIEALRLLLGREALAAPAPSGTPPLLAAIQATRRGQAELSSALGERVRLAVEILLRESREAIDAARANKDHPVTNRDVYIAAARIVMRLVVILFAESRNLLPRDNTIYWNSYSLDFLRDALPVDKDGRPFNHLFHQYSAWPRLLALCRLLYNGSAHEKLPIMRYGGGLFTPGKTDDADPVLCALSAFENPRHSLSDAAVAKMLDLITRAPIKVRQGRGAMTVMAAVDFSQLDTEYIGILYEGLLDYELRRVEDAIPVLFLNLGDQPALPLLRLKEMDDRTLAGLVEKLKAKDKPPTAGEEAGEEGEEEREEISEDEIVEEDAPGDVVGVNSLVSSIFDDNDNVRRWREDAHTWARRAAEVGKIVNRPRGQLTPEKQRLYEAELNKAADTLVARLILPGEYYLVRFGGTRKGSGTFYTKPALARPTVRRTLEPLAYKGVMPLTPADILALKICDPACGSGSFLVGALRYLTGALYEALFAHNWLTELPDGSIRWDNPPNPVPPWFAEALKDFSGINEPVPLGAAVETQSAEHKIRARLSRVIVERCLYGVDLDPLAVELARLALWVETMDPFLPFSFLDHKIKCGNALVGCWFDRFQDYPAMAWEREGGDKTHTTGVHFVKETWTKAIKAKRAEMKAQLGDQLDLFIPVADAEKTFENALRLYEAMHAAGLREQDTQAVAYARYREAVATLRHTFDAWCALWFWPAEDLDLAPMPSNFGHLNPDTSAEVTCLARQLRFFHWEIEFPDVFNCSIGAYPAIDSNVSVQPEIAENTPGALTPYCSGFSAIIGNPPWENLQPNPKEWFSNTDPLFRTYGRLESQEWMTRTFRDNPEVERDWLLHNAQSKAFSNWVSNVADPLGIGDSEESASSKFYSKTERSRLRAVLRRRKSFADKAHPFRLQVGRIFTYRLFLEQGLNLLRLGGRFGLIVPSSICTDSWTTPMRRYLLDHCSWEYVLGFINWNKIFPGIYYRFKFSIVGATKGGHTEVIQTAFSRYNEEDLEYAEKLFIPYTRFQVQHFSPQSLALLEARNLRDLELLTRVYANGVLLGDDCTDGWKLKYALEFMMNSDAKLFPPRPQWEAKGYTPDEYGHWLTGKWQLITEAPGDISEFVRSRDGSQFIYLKNIENVALPLYEGRMIGQFDFSSKGWISGKGRGAVWSEQSFSNKVLSPQFLMDIGEAVKRLEDWTSDTKIVFMDIASSTNARTMTAAFCPNFPSGHSCATFRTSLSRLYAMILTGALSSLTFDMIIRQKISGLHVSLSYLEECPLPRPARSLELIAGVVIRLSLTSSVFASTWLHLGKRVGFDPRFAALTVAERKRLACIIDAFFAHAYSINEEDFRWILVDCDHPVEVITSKSFMRTLDPKGFWRVEKNQPPELRHTVLSQVAFADLQVMIRTHGEEEALHRFIGSGPDDGWMLPEKLRLADYNLGHDARAQEPQSVATTLGPRFFEWQLTQSAEESWAECRRHAENIRRIRAIGIPIAVAEPTANVSRKASKAVTQDSPTMEAPDLFSWINTEQPSPAKPAKQAVGGSVPVADRIDLLRALVLDIVNGEEEIARQDLGRTLYLATTPRDCRSLLLDSKDKQSLDNAVSRLTLATINGLELRSCLTYLLSERIHGLTTTATGDFAPGPEFTRVREELPQGTSDLAHLARTAFGVLQDNQDDDTPEIEQLQQRMTMALT